MLEGGEQTRYRMLLGFQSKKFGRTALLSSLDLKHREHLIEYFDSNIDENNNRHCLTTLTANGLQSGNTFTQSLKKSSLNHLQRC